MSKMLFTFFWLENFPVEKASFYNMIIIYINNEIDTFNIAE